MTRMKTCQGRTNKEWNVFIAWWRHQIDAISAVSTLWNPPVADGFPSHRPVTRNFDVFVDVRVNKRLRKQSRCRWFETPWCSWWRHCNGALSLWEDEPAKKTDPSRRQTRRETNGPTTFTSSLFHILRPKQNIHHLVDDIFKLLLLFENICIFVELSLKIWFNKQNASIGSDNGLAPRQVSHYLNQRWYSLQTHICNRPKWVIIIVTRYACCVIWYMR